MSEIRLVRCRKCDKVLPEPSQFAVYKCGACGAVLRAKRSTLDDGGLGVLEKLVNSDKGEKQGLGGSKERPFDQKGALDMACRSPARLTIGDGMGRKTPTRENDYDDEGLSKSPMRERFLSDLGSVPNSPTRSRNVSRSPMRERGSGDYGFDGVGRAVPSSPTRSGNVSRSPMRERGSGDYGFDGVGRAVPSSPTRSGNVSRSPMRERVSGDFGFDGVGRVVPGAPTRSGSVSSSPMRDRGSADFGFDGVGGPVPSSPTRSGNVSRSPMRERSSGDFGFDGVGRSVRSSPTRSRNVSRSPMRERGSSDFDYDGAGRSPARMRNANKSPMREGRAKTPMTVRSRNVTRSPMRLERTYADVEGVSKSPARPINGDYPKSPRRRVNVSEYDMNAEAEQEWNRGGHSGVREDLGGKNMNPKTSFNVWLPDDEKIGQSDDNYPGRRKTWREPAGDRFDQISEGRESVYSDEYRTAPEWSSDYPTHGIGPSEEMMGRNMGFRGDYVGGHATSRENAGQWGTRRDGMGVVRGNANVIVERSRISASSRTGDGPSSCLIDSNYGYGDPRHSLESLRGPASAQDLDLKRAELRRKYKELNEQLGDMKDNRLYSRPDDYSEDESWRFNRGPTQQFAPDKSLRGPPFFNHSHGPVHNVGDMYNVHPPLYDDPFSGQGTRGPHPKQSHHLQKTRMSHYVPGGRSLDFDHDPLESYQEKTRYHHPACSCSLCYVNNRQGQDLPGSLASRRSANLAPMPRFSNSMDLERHDRRAFNPMMAQTTSQEQPSDLGHRHRRRVPMTKLNKRLCQPIYGGAPFILCHKCFRLLKLPRKLMIMQKNQYQVQCGGCSALVSFDLQNRPPGQLSSQILSDSISGSSGFNEALKESGPKRRHNSCAATSTNIGSYDFDAVGYSFPSGDSGPSEVPKGARLDANFADNTRLSPSPSCSSKEECISENASSQSSLPNSAEMPLKTNLVRPPPGSPLRDPLPPGSPMRDSLPPGSTMQDPLPPASPLRDPFLPGSPLQDRPPPGSPLQDHLDYSSYFRKREAGEVTSYSGDGKPVTKEDNCVGSCLENTAVATEVEVPPNEVPATSLSQDSEDVPGDKLKSGGNKDKNSSASAFKRWGFVSGTGHGSPGRAEVYVNGQPIQQRLVKKAEKLAGRIQPGDYWYDSKAGFWGVMGHCCSGIIPPFIQEFSFPMAMNCSGGDTVVYVNGRELQKRDLDLLASRGLPTTKNKSYIVDISGKVLDEETKEFVVNLGKLAPTVEKNRCGFGMQVPKDIPN